MAGSLQGDHYVGGNIALGSSTNARGNVLAGNEFNSGGSTTVHGFITALGGGTTTYNSMGGSTNIIVDQLPPTFIPMGEISAGGGDGNCEGNGCAPTPSGFVPEVLWARYL